MRSAKHRTQISLEEWQYHALSEMSRKTKKSLSSIIRELLSEKFLEKAVKAENDPIFGIIGIGAGDGSPVAREHDNVLYGKKR